MNLNLTDGQWNHICLVRLGVTNRTRVFINGKVVYTLFSETSFIRSGGPFIVGNDLNQTDGSFNETRSFVGMITQDNMWSKGFDNDSIASLSRACWGIPGDIIEWSGFINGSHGDIQLLNTSECHMPGKPSYARLKHFFLHDFVLNIIEK